MAWPAKVIEIFLSSPSDVSRERALVRKIIDEWNQRRAQGAGCIFSVLGWESVTAELEEYAQGSINDQIGDQYDVMLGLMWARYGTPTGKEDSGTFEEFKRALDRKRGGDAVRISFYFKRAAVDIDKIDPDQIAKVRNFERFIMDHGGLAGSFSDDGSLRRNVDLLLERIAREQDKYTTKRSNGLAQVQTAESPNQSDAIDPASGQGSQQADDELGLLDLMERSDQLVAEFSSEMEDWTRNIVELGDISVAATADLEELAQFGNPPAAGVRKIVDRVTAEFNENAKFVEERSARITGLMSEFAALIDGQTRILGDFELAEETAQLRFKQLTELHESIVLAGRNAQAMIDSVSELPRMSVGFNIARQRIVRAYEPFLRELEVSTRAIENAIAAMRRALPDFGEERPPPSLPSRKPSPTRPNTKRSSRRRKGQRKRK